MRLTVLQWNIWYKEEIENIIRELKKINADVICLQELSKNHPDQSHSDTIAFISNQLGYHVCSSDPMGRDDVVRTQFNAIFSKYPITDRLQSWINTPTGSGGASDEFRSYTQGTLNIASTQVLIATTHMSYADYFEANESKIAETDRLVECIKDKSSLILTGDFNASPNSYTVQQVEQHLGNSGPDYNQNTWTTKPFKHGDFEANTLDWRLDYIFATRNIRVISSEIIETPHSDHLPILVTFDI